MTSLKCEDATRKSMKLTFFKTAIIMVAVFSFGAVCQTSSSLPYEKGSEMKLQFGSETAWASKSLTGKNYALLTNAPSQVHFNLLDSLIRHKKIRKIFSPEHGFATDHADGVVISSTENYRNIPVVSLYGKHLNPDSMDFENIDTVLIDIQDVGLRFYTYISTVTKVLESAGKYKIPVIILDRPNPLNGNTVEGPIVEDSLKSFVGYLPIPVRYGLTMGELFQMAVSEKWIKNSDSLSLEIVRLQNWNRSYYWKDLNLKWIATSPNLPTFESVAMYSGTCLFEGTNISEGRGTDSPFLWIGADFLTKENIDSAFGISAKSVVKTPVSIKGKSVNPKYENKSINGYSLTIENYNRFSALNWTTNFIELNKKNLTFRKHFYLLWGKPNLKLYDNDILQMRNFEERRKQYFLY